MNSLRVVASFSCFLGVNLNLNHLIGSGMANYDWPFGTLFLEFLGQIWTQWTLRHILGPILVIFDICQFLMIPGPLSIFKKWVLSENHFFLDEGAIA